MNVCCPILYIFTAGSLLRKLRCAATMFGAAVGREACVPCHRVECSRGEGRPQGSFRAAPARCWSSRERSRAVACGRQENLSLPCHAVWGCCRSSVSYFLWFEQLPVYIRWEAYSVSVPFHSAKLSTKGANRPCKSCQNSCTIGHSAYSPSCTIGHFMLITHWLQMNCTDIFADINNWWFWSVKKKNDDKSTRFFGQGCQTSLTTLDGILIKKGGLFLGSFPNFL